MSKFQLSVSEREHLLKTLPLTFEQKDFLLHHVKRGKKTIFSNIMAKDKGIVLPEHATNEEIDMLLDEWILDDYIDNGYVNPETRCECGRPLRYQYIVRHKTTSEKRRFGIDHFEEHTNIPAAIVKDIKKGFHTIDHELDELLVKISENWSLDAAVPHLPDEFPLPKNIKAHLDNQVPLLDRQIELLRKEIRTWIERPERVIDNIKRISVRNNINQKEDQISFEFDLDGSSYEEVAATIEKENKTQLFSNLPLEEQIFQFVKDGTSSARIICELLIKHELVPNERYLTGKPKVFVRVCQYLDTLVEQSVIKHRTIFGTDDRKYEL